MSSSDSSSVRSETVLVTRSSSGQLTPFTVSASLLNPTSRLSPWRSTRPSVNAIIVDLAGIEVVIDSYEVPDIPSGRPMGEGTYSVLSPSMTSGLRCPAFAIVTSRRRTSPTPTRAVAKCPSSSTFSCFEHFSRIVVGEYPSKAYA